MNLTELISKHPVPATRFQRPYVIAEAGVNHEGSMDIARRLIDEAALGGADAIKFQTYKAGTLASKHSPAYWDTTKEPTPSQYELFKKHDSFWKNEFENLKKHCDQAGIAFMSTPFDVESAKFLNDMMDVFKISSSDLTNRPFIEFMCDFKKPIIMSTGAASLAEIAEAVSWIEAKGNPLAARKPGDPYQDGEVPDTDYNVVVFENRFPSMVRVPGVSEDVTYVDGNPLWEKKLAAGRCEVICFDPNEDGLPADLPVSRLRTVVEAWAFRTAEISKMEGIEQIFPFENHGQEIGVSLAHPHGQVYCYPFIAPKMEKELQHTEAYHEKTGGNLLKDIMNAELEAGERIVMRNHSWVAYVPAAARWPLEVHVAPVRDVLTLDQLNDEERWDLASMYSHLLKRGNAFFDKGDGKGMDLPYIAAWHQAPIHDARRENYRLNLQFFSFRRAANKIKYLAGSESGMAAWISDTTPELIAKRFHELGSIDIAD